MRCFGFLPATVVQYARFMKERIGRWIRLASLVVAFAFVFGRPTTAHAYAWMIKHEYTSCATCHADPSGGELLTKYGRATSDIVLRMHYKKQDGEPETPKTGVLWGLWDTPDNLLISGSYRSLTVMRPDQADPVKFIPVMVADLGGQLTLGNFMVGGTIGLGRSARGAVHGAPAQVTTNEDGYNLLSRTHYVGMKLGDSVWVRGGRLNLPFGVRMPEHTTWVRDATRTDRDSDQQHGVSLAYVGERIRMEAMAIAGNYQLGPDRYRERGYSLFIEGVGAGNIAAGLSSKVTYAGEDRITGEVDSVRQAHGMMMRWAPVQSLVVMAEFDALFRSRADAGYVGFTQIDYEPVGGLHFLLTGEMLDEGLAIQSPAPVSAPGQGQPKFGFWASIDWFLYTQLEVRIDAIARQNEPFTLLGQFHLYL